jgi:hypothetical protein
MRSAVSAGAMIAAAMSVSPLAWAAPVRVTVTGTVEFNLINPPPLGDPNPGDAVAMSITVESGVFTDSPSFPTRGYPIDETSFTLTLGSTTVHLAHPFPAGETPYFVLRNDDPAVDGFFISTSVDFPAGVPLDVTGNFGPFIDSFSVTYLGDTLGSLDILDAQGTYDFTGLTVYHWTVDDGPFEPLGIIFETMTIEVETPCADLDGDGAVGITDLLSLLGAWGRCAACPQDLDADGDVGITDLLALLAAWGPCA